MCGNDGADQRKLITTLDACVRLGLTTTRPVHALIASGELPAVWAGDGFRVDDDDIERLRLSLLAAANEPGSEESAASSKR